MEIGYQWNRNFVILINNPGYNEAVLGRFSSEKIPKIYLILKKKSPKNGANTVPTTLYTLVRDGVALNRNGDWLPMLTKNTVQMHTVCLRKL